MTKWGVVVLFKEESLEDSMNRKLKKKHFKE
jgi:hypothetical protein